MEAPLTKPRLCFVVASEMTVQAFLLDHLRALSVHFDLSLVVDTTDPDLLSAEGIDVRVFPITITRRINLRRDVAALRRLVDLFRRERFDAVHSVTPKAGLLAMTAAAISGIPCRTHTFTGQVWATRRGPMRLLLKSMDKITARATTSSLADSASQLAFLVGEGVVIPQRSQVLANGSLSGVDPVRFRPDPEARRLCRDDLGLDQADVLLLHVGRLNPDKGVLDLAQAFVNVGAERAQLHLLFVGPDEGGLQDKIERLVAPLRDRVHFVGFTADPERYMAAADVLCLPSYREGFGSVVIEAAAVGIPALASRIYGVTDAVQEEYSGLLHEPRNIEQIEVGLRKLIDDRPFRERLGQQARARAISMFSVTVVVEALVGYYTERVGSNEHVPADLATAQHILECVCP